MSALRTPAPAGGTIFRHTLNVRICHWINVVAVVYLLLRGLVILGNYPELYWGKVGYRGHEPAFRLAEWGINIPKGDNGWGRNTHFLFAWIFSLNGLVYLIWTLVRRDRRRKLLPQRDQLAWHHVRADLQNHLRLRPPRGDAALRYNVLQKFSYLFIVLALAPLIVLTGLAQSPGFTAAVPSLLDLFGGRQSARTLHVIGMVLMLLFIVVHVAEVFIAGAVNELRAMVTGRFRIPRSDA